MNDDAWIPNDENFNIPLSRGIYVPLVVGLIGLGILIYDNTMGNNSYRFTNLEQIAEHGQVKPPE